MPDSLEPIKSLQLRGRAAAERFVELLTSNVASVVHWRIKQDVLPIARDETDDRHYAFNRHGSLAELWADFEREQANFRSPFMIVNEGGHKSRDITRVRAVYIDVDSGTKLADMEWHVPPHFIVARSASKFHAYWLADISLDQFRDVQKRLIARYGSDAAIHDLSRVMRVPGFNHLKDPDQPNPVILIDRLADVPAEMLFDHRLGFDQVTAGLPELPPIVPREPSAKKGKPARLSIVRDMASWINFDRPHATPLGELSVRDGWMQALWAIRDAALDPDLSEDERLEFCDDMSSGKLTSERTGEPCDPLAYDGFETVADYFNQQPTGNAANPVGIGLIETLARLDGYSGPPLSYESMLDHVSIAPIPSTALQAYGRWPSLALHGDAVGKNIRSAATVIANFVPAQGVTAVLGKRGGGKTLILLDMALCLASDSAWCSQPTKKGTHVVYFCGEDQDNTRRHVLAWSLKHGKAIPDRFHFAPAVPDLFDSEDCDSLVAYVRSLVPPDAFVIVIFDTWQRASGRASQSDDDKMQAAFHRAEAIARALRGPALIAFHPPKSEVATIMGSSVMDNDTASILHLHPDPAVPSGQKLEVIRIKGAGLGCYQLFDKAAVIETGGCDDHGGKHTGAVVVRVGGSGDPSKMDQEDKDRERRTFAHLIRATIVAAAENGTAGDNLSSTQVAAKLAALPQKDRQGLDYGTSPRMTRDKITALFDVLRAYAFPDGFRLVFTRAGSGKPDAWRIEVDREARDEYTSEGSGRLLVTNRDFENDKATQ